MINWPGKISVMNVDDMAQFIYRVSLLPPRPGDWELYLPSTEALTFADMSRMIYEVRGMSYSRLNMPSSLWRLFQFVAKRKNYFEPLTPHKLYNKIWQFFLLINSEFWNLSVKMDRVIPDWQPVTFKEYHSRKLTD